MARSDIACAGRFAPPLSFFLPPQQVTGEATPNATGKLEVQIVGGPLLHSKIQGGGYIDTSEKVRCGERTLHGAAATLAALAWILKDP